MSTSINFLRERSTYVSLFNQQGNKTTLVLFNLKLCTAKAISFVKGTNKPIHATTAYANMIDMYSVYQSLLNNGFKGKLGKMKLSDVKHTISNYEKVS